MDTQQKTFKAGDTVMLKTLTGPKMVVTSALDGREGVNCTYWNEATSEFKSVDFEPELLQSISQ